MSQHIQNMELQEIELEIADEEKKDSENTPGNNQNMDFRENGKTNHLGFKWIEFSKQEPIQQPIQNRVVKH